MLANEVSAVRLAKFIAKRLVLMWAINMTKSSTEPRNIQMDLMICYQIGIGT